MPQPGFVHLNGHLLAGVDVETTGKVCGYHDIIQVGIQPVDSQCEPLKDVIPFNFTIKPNHPDRVDPHSTQVHGFDIDHLMIHSPDSWQVADYLDEWIINLDLPHKKKIVPVASNWRFDASFLIAWLGLETFDQFFYHEARDIIRLASGFNDRAYFRGHSAPFPWPSLASLCAFFSVENENPHDALADARAECKVYKKLIEYQENTH